MKRTFAFLLFITGISVFADDYKIAVFHSEGVSVYNTNKCNEVSFQTDSLVLCKSEAFAVTEIDSILTSYSISDDTIRIVWNGLGAEYFNPKADAVHIKSQQGHIEILSEDEEQLNVVVSGRTINGSLSINGNTAVHIISKGLALTSVNREAINVKGKKSITFECLEKTIISDGNTRNEEDSTICKACIYAQGNLIIKGNDSLLVYGNYKNAIRCTKHLTTDANIRIMSAAGSGIKAKKLMTVEGGSIVLENISNNGIEVEKGDFIFNKGQIDVRLTKADTKGIKADSLYIQNGGSLLLNLLADQCKGIKTKGGIRITGGEVTGEATGGVVVTDGDPSYCTFLKCDGDIAVSDARLDLRHRGEGGKCISADGDFKFHNAIMSAKLTGNGGWYINEDGEDDYYTPRAIEADDSLTIASGNLDIHCTGIGGKGIVCDRDLTIGELYGDNDKLHINITTEGTSIVNDTIADFRKGCPKAIKSGDKLGILSGNINIKTCGMGGEGLESKNVVYIVNGNIVCDTFDDGINGEKSILVHGGTIYCCSKDNDGFDSNGFISIYGGTIFSVSLHEKNESFDTEGNTFYIYGGTLLGIGGGTVFPNFSAIPFYSYSRWTSGILQEPMPDIDLNEGNYISVIQDDRIILSGKIPASMKSAIITIASENLFAGQKYNFAETDDIKDCIELLGGRLLFDGCSNIIVPLFTFEPKFYY